MIRVYRRTDDAHENKKNTLEPGALMVDAPARVFFIPKRLKLILSLKPLSVKRNNKCTESFTSFFLAI
jgi:hypothetical protein